MSALNRSIPKVPQEEAFVVTIGVSHANQHADCARALSVLHSAGFVAGETSHDSILILAEQVKAVQELEDNEPTGESA